jgi:hypothetical protein
VIITSESQLSKLIKRLELYQSHPTRDASRWVRHLTFPTEESEEWDILYDKILTLMPQLISFNKVWVSFTIDDARTFVKFTRDTLRSLTILVNLYSFDTFPLLNGLSRLAHLAIEVNDYSRKLEPLLLDQPLNLATVRSISITTTNSASPALFSYFARCRFAPRCLDAHLSIHRGKSDTLKFLETFFKAHQCCKVRLNKSEDFLGKLGAQLGCIRRVVFDSSMPKELPFKDGWLPDVLELHLSFASETVYGVQSPLWDLMWDITEQHHEQNSSDDGGVANLGQGSREDGPVSLEDAMDAMEENTQYIPAQNYGDEDPSLAVATPTQQGHMHHPTPATHMESLSSLQAVHTPLRHHHSEESPSISAIWRPWMNNTKLIRFAVRDGDYNMMDIEHVQWRMDGDNMELAAFIRRMLKFAIMLYYHDIYMVDDDWRYYKGVLRLPGTCGCQMGHWEM